MRILTALFFLFIFLVATFCFVVLLGHGIGDFVEGAQIEMRSLLRWSIPADRPPGEI